MFRWNEQFRLLTVPHGYNTRAVLLWHGNGHGNFAEEPEACHQKRDMMRQHNFDSRQQNLHRGVAHGVN